MEALYNLKRGGKQMKNNKGITLIALVITIIILIILAGIAINAVFGENGLLTKTSEAKNITKQAAFEEKVKLVAGAAYINYTKNHTGATGYTFYDSVVEALKGEIDIIKLSQNEDETIFARRI